MRRVLMVAYYFPPLGGIGSVRMREFARHLPACGWQPTVVAPRNGAYMRDERAAFPEDRIVRSTSVELSRLGKRALRTGGDDVQPARVGRLGGALRAAARTMLYYPDAQVGWFAPAVLSGRRALREQHFDLIFSSSFPITAHLIARRLSRNAALPWIAEFRDPWSERMALGTLARTRAERLEAAIAHSASGLVMTSPDWARLHSAKWQRPVCAITNGHDIDSMPAFRLGPPGEFILGYLGSFYPDKQNLSAAFEAVRQLNDAGEKRVDRVRVIGEIHPGMRAELEQRGLGSLLDVTGFIPHDRAMEALCASSALLFAGPADTRKILRGEIASKLFEYLASGLPIVYVGVPDCDAADLLRQYAGCYILGIEDAAGIARVLACTGGQRYERDLTALSRQALTGRLAAMFDAACGR